MFISRQNQLHPSCFHQHICCKDIVNLFFWILYACLATHTINDTIILYKTFMFICRQKINLIPHAFMEILQRYETYFGNFGHAWLHSPEIIVSPCRRLQCLSACKKQTSSFTSFIRYYSLENPANWLADSILAYNPRPRILPDMMVKYQ